MLTEKSDIKSIRDYLINKDINPSFQRLKILEYLINTREHPTVDTIYTNLVKVIPTISKTTIYNTLKLFTDKGIARGLTIDENEIRYEFSIEPHAHLKCVRCGGVFDITTEFPCEKYESIEGHKILECHLYFRGICKNCLKNE